MRYWIDIANAPHVTLFRPVVEELRARGNEVVITAWDRGQAHELAVAEWPDAVVVGRAGFRRPILAKATSIFDRARGLAAVVRPLEPHVALGHNSYAQIVAARMLGLRTLTAMDYEHQPANHLAFRLAHVVILPVAIPAAAVRRYGVSERRIRRYHGLKEDIALAHFRPDPGFRGSIGVGEDEPLVTVRPPAEGAGYHRKPNLLFEALLPELGKSGACVLLTPRTPSQGDRFRSVPGIRVLDQVVSGPDLLFHSDIVIGAGGTMTREAAVLGTRSYTVFSGEPAAVDRWLVAAGRLHVLDDAIALAPNLIRRQRHDGWSPSPRVLHQFVDLVEIVATRGHRRPVRG